MDTVTNIILNNEYDLHEKEEKIESPKEENYKKINKYENNKKKSKHAKNIENTKKGKKKKTTKQKIFLVVKIIITLIILGIIGIFLFFKTSLFEKYKELWVVTAMSTMNHQYLATWFLSDEEIQEIMKKLEVQNNEDSNSNEIKIEIPSENKKEEIKVDKNHVAKY